MEVVPSWGREVPCAKVSESAGGRLGGAGVMEYLWVRLWRG